MSINHAYAYEKGDQAIAEIGENLEGQVVQGFGAGILRLLPKVDTTHENPQEYDLSNLDPMGRYLRGSREYPLLSKEQEVDLAKRIEAGQYASHKLEEPGLHEEVAKKGEIEAHEVIVREGKEALTRLFGSNIRLVVSEAKKLGYTPEDKGFEAISDGNMGLVHAIEKFDYKKGYKFSTYATFWIRQAIQQGTREAKAPLYLPKHVFEKRDKINKMREGLTVKELASKTGYTTAQVRDNLSVTEQFLRCSSLDQTLPGGEDEGQSTVGSQIADPAWEEPFIKVETDCQAESTPWREQAWEILTEREKQVLTLIYGLEGDAMAKTTIAKKFGVTRQTIMNTENRALKKLRGALAITDETA